jgi:hypothetical protein
MHFVDSKHVMITDATKHEDHTDSQTRRRITKQSFGCMLRRPEDADAAFLIDLFKSAGGNT